MERGLKTFLQELAESGEVLIGVGGEPDAAEVTACREVILRQGEVCAREVAGAAPRVSMEAAGWAAGMMYAGCRFLVRREIGKEEVAARLEMPCPVAMSAEVCFSVDLYFRYLPDLIGLARGISEGDPLVVGLMGLAKQWPLSSVGVKGVGDVDVSGFIGHAGLRQLYVDRVIQRRDVARVKGDEVKEAMAETVGGYPGEFKV
jgi:hypothetical protein